MSKATISVTIDFELADKLNDFDNKSKAVSEALRKHLDEPEAEEWTKILPNSGLSPMQNHLLEAVFRQGEWPYTRQEVFDIAKSQVGYTRTGDIKQAIKKMDRVESVPVELRDGKVRAEKIHCDCGAGYHASLVFDNDCKICGREFRL
jgi:hypothetical protein